jgi:HSP20 family protein
MATIARLEPFRGLSNLHDQVSRLFNEAAYRGSEASALTSWAPTVDIYETPNELVVKADLPDVNEKDIDIRIENNLLTIRGERKFETSVPEDSYLRIERTYGSFSRSFSLPNTVSTDAIRANYNNGVLTVVLPKREETKPRQVKINVNAVPGGSKN